MIARAAGLLAMIYLLGFALFAFTLGRPLDAADRKADGGVVLTGGKGRIEHAVAALANGDIKRLLISGTDPLVTKEDLVRRIGGARRLINCCVDLEKISDDTRSNAREAKGWVDQHGYRSILLITSDYHMRRAAFDFGRELHGKVDLKTDAVRTDAPFLILFGEYNKYVLRRLAVWTRLT